jgi:hypothetical protein
MKAVLKVLNPFSDIKLIEVYEVQSDSLRSNIFTVTIDGAEVLFCWTEDGIWDTKDNIIDLPAKAIIYVGDLIETIKVGG